MPIELPHGRERPSATATLHSILATTISQYPEAFGALSQLDAATRRSPKRTADLLTRFEVLRATSGRSLEIATFITDLIQQQFVLAAPSSTQSLEQAFAGDAAPLPTSDVTDRIRSAGSAPAATTEVRTLADLTEQVSTLEQQQHASAEALLTLRSALAQMTPAGDPGVDLTGRRFVLLGGTAELAPLALLLASGADILTTHTAPDSLRRAAVADSIADRRHPPGRLFAIDGGVDLLAVPERFAASAIAFAENQPVHVGAFAYRGGQAREWRLTACMDAIIRRMHRSGAVASITYYLSPSVPLELSPETARVSARRLAEKRSFLTEAGRKATGNALFEPNLIESDGRFWPRSLVTRQGTSYQAGNLFGKNYAAEIYADRARSGQSPLRLSANVAPITRTRSTETAQAAVAFSELDHFGIRVFEPGLVRWLMFLMMMRDLLEPSPGANRVPFARQVHGGVFTNAWALNSVLQLAYLKARAKGKTLAAPERTDAPT